MSSTRPRRLLARQTGDDDGEEFRVDGMEEAKKGFFFITKALIEVMAMTTHTAVKQRHCLEEGNNVTSLMVTQSLYSTLHVRVEETSDGTTVLFVFHENSGCGWL